jgi:hypothetical protein
MPSARLTYSATIRWRASAVSGAADEYFSGLRDTTIGSLRPDSVSSGYTNRYARVSSWTTFSGRGGALLPPKNGKFSAWLGRLGRTVKIDAVAMSDARRGRLWPGCELGG